RCYCFDIRSVLTLLKCSIGSGSSGHCGSGQIDSLGVRFEPLVRRGDDVRKHQSESQTLYPKRKLFTLVFICIGGFYLIYCGLWNLKFGVEEWRGKGFFFLGACWFMYGFCLFLNRIRNMLLLRKCLLGGLRGLLFTSVV